MFRFLVTAALLLTAAAPPASAEGLEATCAEPPGTTWLDWAFLSGTNDVGNLHMVYLWTGPSPGTGNVATNVFAVLTSNTSGAFGVLASVSCGVVDLECVYEAVIGIQPGISIVEELAACVSI